MNMCILHINHVIATKHSKMLSKFKSLYWVPRHLSNCTLNVCVTWFLQERLKRRNTLGCLDQYAAQNNKYAVPLIPSQPPTLKVFQWHTQYDPTMKHSHCETVYAKELFQWLFFELVHPVRILSILPTFKLAGLTKEFQWCTLKAQFGQGLKLKTELKINFN